MHLLMIAGPRKHAYSLLDNGLTCTRPLSQVQFCYNLPYHFLLAAEVATMHVKITPNNQITSPDEIASQVEAAKYPDVEVDNANIVLTPVLAQSVEAVRDKLIASGISEKDVADASAWARRPKE